MSGKKAILLFVEGDSDKEFYEALIQYYRQHSKKTITATVRIINIKGIGRYESKVPSKVKNEYLPKYTGDNVSVICSYDTDVFDFAEKPPTDWKVVEKKITELKVAFHEIKVRQMIEDWFLLDVDGLCKFLKITKPSKIEGKDGYTKIKTLFRKGSKAYLKGGSCGKFVSHIDIAKIRSKIVAELASLEKLIGFQPK